jgi:N-acetylmuramoyl-L-alanine amidase
MQSKVKRASTAAVAATFVSLLFGAQGSGAVAQDKLFEIEPAATLSMISQPVVQPLPVEAAPEAPDASDSASSDPAASDDAESTADSLAELVAAHAEPEELSPEMHCLAGAIYFESKGESLPGQLAVGRVIVNRAKSGRFPDSYCGVVYQPSQFSFVRGRSMPAIRTNSQDWRKAVAIAQIADADKWRSPVEGALFFHASYVSPRWRLTRIARVDNHIFYR